MRGRLPRYYHQRNEREGTVIEVKRDSRPFMGYGIVTMKLALGWTDASGDRQWLRWSLHRVEELCRNIVAVLVVFCRCRWRYRVKFSLRASSRSQSRLADSYCSSVPTSVRSPREIEEAGRNDLAVIFTLLETNYLLRVIYKENGLKSKLWEILRCLRFWY